MAVGFHKLSRGIPEAENEDLGFIPRAEWLDPSELYNEKWKWKPGKILLGAALKGEDDPNEHLIGLNDNRHLMTIAGSRAGKGTSAIIPNLLTYPGSVLVIDPKGENATLTAKRRAAMGQDVYVIDPFGVADVPDEMRAGFNPFADLSPVSEDFIDECDAIADALIVPEPGKENDHWNSNARDILRGFIAWVIGNPEGNARTLVEVKRLLSGVSDDPEEEDGLAQASQAMIDNEHVAWGIPAEIASRISGMGENELGSVLSTTSTNLSFIDSPQMARCLSETARSPDLKRWKYGDMSIYLCLPAGRLHRHFRFFRLVLNRLMGVIEGDEGNKELPALMILDEAALIGYLAVLEKSMGFAAGLGVKIWTIWQDINQLKRNYKGSWETFVGNCGLLQVFGLNDMTTLKYISERLGKSVALKFSWAALADMSEAQGQRNQGSNLEHAPLLDTHEIAEHFDRDTGYQLLITTGTPPIYARRIPYWHDVYKEYRS